MTIEEINDSDLRFKAIFVKELLDNLPEYAESFYVESWDYEKCEFKLIDQEDGKHYLLTLPVAIVGFDKLTEQIDAGKFPGFVLSAAYKSDGGEWGSDVVDALLQMAVLGEVIYG
jgi:hypothetical protein